MSSATVYSSNASLADSAVLLHRINHCIRQSKNLQEISTLAATEIQSFLGTDQVKIYQFHIDGSGQVIAEARRHADFPSLLGLNFPADDIPPHARELFIQSRTRVVVDVATGQIGHSTPTNGDTTNHAEGGSMAYRPADPCHLEYLTTMGIPSSLVMPIMLQDELWGLLVSHHATPWNVSPETLQALQEIVDQLSIAIALYGHVTEAEQISKRETTLNRISGLLMISTRPRLAKFTSSLSPHESPQFNGCSPLASSSVHGLSQHFLD